MSTASFSGKVQPFWVELLDRHGAVVSRQRVHDGALSVGRGYDNDLIIDDPFVAPAHLRIGYDADGALWIEDLAAQPPAASANDAPGATRMLVGSEASIRIGHTTLRVRTAAFAVPPALSLGGNRGGTAGGFLEKALGCASIFILLSLLSTWLGQTGEYKLASYLPEGLIFPLVALAWAGSWALVTRIIAVHAQFFRHVYIVFAVLLALFALDTLADFLSYSLAWPLAKRWLPVTSWIVLGVLFFAHIHVIVPRRARLAAGIISSLVVLVIGVHISLRMESDRAQAQRIAAKLMPPYLLLKGAVAPDAFFREVEALRPKLEEARKKEPASGGPSFDDAD